MSDLPLPSVSTLLQSEWRRLYLARSGALCDADGLVRCLVLELAGPPEWRELARVWQGVQAELDLPAPGIAVSGVDGLQLWFSLADPVTVQKGQVFLQGLVARFLADVEPRRLRLLPTADQPVRLVPAEQVSTGNWSAFLAPDLAPVFADTPWLDIPPGDEGQTALLRGLAVIRPSLFEAAVSRLSSRAAAAVQAAPGAGGESDPRQFLLRVMNDESVAMALRIEAAKALLPHLGTQSV